jgi:hypothetical protein
LKRLREDAGLGNTSRDWGGEESSTLSPNTDPFIVMLENLVACPPPPQIKEKSI